ncbi:MAG: protein translocase subunit SecF [Planctomycetota bacterium]|nr:MAG: protein translocase subunit SecF [Planctomycetota bacterium]
MRSAIYRSGIIEGRFTREEVERLVATLQGGALVGRLIPEGEFQVGPALGEHAVKLGIIAIIVALGAVLVFMGCYYLAAGLVADLAMLANLILIAGTLAVSEATFTLPGLAGLVLTVGMAVDANILIFERVREERKGGKSLRQSLELGFKRAFWTIFDANITTLLTAIILMMAGTGPVKGFAVVLAIGIACTMFSALFISHTLLNSLADKKIVRDYKMMQFVKEPKYNFVRWTKPAVTVSAILVVAGIVLFFLRGRKVYGIEFTGGIHYQVCLIKPTTVAEMRKRLAKTNLFEDLKVTAAYTGLPNEDPKRGLSSQFVVKARLKEGALKASSKSVSQAEAVSNEVKKALAGLLAPEGFPSSDQLKKLQKSYAEQGKIVFDVVVKAKENLNERLKDATTAALKKIGELKGDPEIKVTALSPEKVGLEGELASLFEAFRVETKKKVVVKVRTASGDFAEAKPEELLIKIRKPLIEELRPSKKEPSLVPTQFIHKQDIGPAVASDLKAKAFVALLLAMIAIVIYIGIRFELIYGVAAVVALAHDVCVALGVGLLFDMLGIIEYKLDLAVIAAFLTIVGYSLNDTIVVFDRIREMVRRRRFAVSQRGKLSEIINTSINACLSRTLLTSLTTFLAIFVLFIFGVKSLQGFTFTMLVGVVVGTYSSIYIASPILLLMRGETGEPKPAKAAKKTPDMVYLKETQKRAKAGKGKKGRKR